MLQILPETKAKKVMFWGLHVYMCVCTCVCERESRKWWIDFNETWKGGKWAKENPFNFGEDLHKNGKRGILI